MNRWKTYNYNKHNTISAKIKFYSLDHISSQGFTVITEFFRSIDWQAQKTRIIATVAIVSAIGLYLYSDYRERQELREHNAKLYQKYLEMKKDFKFLKSYVKSFESSRWNEAVLNVQNQTQIVDIDLIEFEKILKDSPLLEHQKGEDD